VSETGSVKFSEEHVPAGIGPFDGFAELKEYRRKLFQLQLIGVDASGIGFGNLSVRDGTTNNFYITGSGTGGKRELGLGDYARVVAYDFARNWLRSEGSVVASSESLTHAAIYEAEPGARAVIHCHNLQLWSALRGRVPTTSEAAEYGTPEMAREVQRLFQTMDVRTKKLFVMAGHEEGVITFGVNLEEAFAVLMRAA
jgi:L-ribulose-5-phosphate 4-epimerase